MIAAGGDGTVAEAAEGLTGTDTVAGHHAAGQHHEHGAHAVHPARSEPGRRGDRERTGADDGRRPRHGRLFLEAGGVGLAAGLFGYFNRLDSGRARIRGVIRGLWRFVTSLGRPRLILDIDGQRVETHARRW